MPEIKKILFITLSNIGDCIMTLPVLDLLKAIYPSACFTVICSQRAKGIFEHNSEIDKVVVFDKKARLIQNFKLFSYLALENFDLVIDLRNTLFQVLLPCRYKTGLIPHRIKGLTHKRFTHFYRLPKIIRKKSYPANEHRRQMLFPSLEDQVYLNNILTLEGISKDDDILIVSPGARSALKRWPKERFVEIIHYFVNNFGFKIVLVGDKEDVATSRYIAQECRKNLVDLTGKTTILQLAYLIKKSFLVITNDSAVCHLASYLNIPTLAVFGPSSDEKYGPWSRISAVVKKDIFCRPCEKAQCRFHTQDCMKFIKSEDLLRQFNGIISNKRRTKAPRIDYPYKRILVSRTDRIGDLVLSTPVLKNLRENFPFSYIAVLVCPDAREIVEGNPYIDEVIICDKDRKHKSWYGSFKLSRDLKKRKFDLALILHPTNRVHLVTFFAGINKRVGYDKKLGFLLTDKFNHTKQLGEKHELEYNLDLLKVIGVTIKDKSLYMPLNDGAEKWAYDFLNHVGIALDDKILAIHPGASCPSKIWPNENFALLADKMVENYGFKILILAGGKDIGLANFLQNKMHYPSINLAGKTSLSQMASLLRRCQLFISNDSGPVHIASALKVPVISIFGRAQKGLSPKRWGPVGEGDIYLHKDLGCIECLAHNCQKEFACLSAISVEDVLQAASQILGK